MKNFDERMAEIVRRSEERIRHRNLQRKKFVAACVPLVLCLGLYAAVTLSGREVTRTFADNTVTYPTVVYTDAPQAPSFRVLSGGVQVSTGNDQALCRLEELLTDIFNSQKTTTVYAHNDTEPAKTDSPAYTVVIGEQEKEYRLRGNVLTDRSNGVEYAITATQRFLLLQILGVKG